MHSRLNFVIVLLSLFSFIVPAQIKIIDFDKAKFKNDVVFDKVTNWKTFASKLSPVEIDGTPSLVINNRPKAPYGYAETGKIDGGCKYFSFDYKRLDGGNCEVMVWVNNTLIATIDQANGQIQSMIKLPVFISGPVVFKFQHFSEKSGSIAIDNILWTPCTNAEASAYQRAHEVPNPKGNLIFEGDFERGNLDNFTLSGNQRNRLVTTPTRSGKYALRSTVDRYDDNAAYRCEIVAKDQNARQGYLYQEVGKEYWYAFSTFIPRDFIIDNLTELIAQFHGTPDEGEDWFLPNFSLHITENHYEINRYWDSKHITNWKERDGEDHYTFGNITDDKEKWTDWVFQIKWSYAKDGDGFMKIWKDGVLIFDKKGPNCSNDDLGPFLRFGLYKWDWRHTEQKKPGNTTHSVIYHDEYRIGNANAKYEEVAPGALSPTGEVKLIYKVK
ncbi:MAG: polysaccharide lyase [Paludibacter sp.]